MKKETSVAVRGEALSPVIDEEMSKLFPDLMEGVEVYLPRINIIHQGAMFEMPDGEMVKSFKGTILDMHKANAYWPQSLEETGGGVFPDCHSLNGITPEQDCADRQGETCATCCKAYRNVKKDKDGKLAEICCKNTKRLHIIVGDSLLPYRLIASVKNMKSVDVYVSLLAGGAIPYPLVETEFSLKKVSSKGGQEYSELILKKVGVSPLLQTRKDAQKIKDMIGQWWKVMRGETDFGDTEV
jgi:hypothetical protein